VGRWGFQGRDTASSLPWESPGLDPWLVDPLAATPGRSHQVAKGLDLEDETGCGLASSKNCFGFLETYQKEELEVCLMDLARNKMQNWPFLFSNK
jgi:hypothetical protein